MYIEDLTTQVFEHASIFSFDSNLNESIDAVMVGWLGKKIRSTGKMEIELLDKLKQYKESNFIDTGDLGHHRCECSIFCKFEDRGEFLVTSGGKNYVLPNMVIHYIEKHKYLPPPSFINSIR
jgi:hypothetical protein